jgi:predicted nucleotidyltransferase
MRTNINKKTIKRLLINNQNRIRLLGIKRVGIFGSYVRGEQNKDSDIDLLVEFFEGEKTFDRFMEISYFLEKILNHRIELVTPEGMSPYIAPHIFKEIEYADFSS